MKGRKYLRKKKILAVFLAVFLATAVFEPVYAENNGEADAGAETATEENAQASTDNVVSDEILIVCDDAGVSDKKSEKIQNEVEESLADKDIQVTEEIVSSGDGQGTVVTADIPKDMDVEEAVEMAMEEDSVVHAQPNYVYDTLENEADIDSELDIDPESDVDSEPDADSEPDIDSEPDELNDTYVMSGETYYLDNAKVKEAWNDAGYDETTQEVTVAVLDTGCRLDHEDLEGNISEKAYDAYYDKPLTTASTVSRGDADGIGNKGHGTHVCGLIAAEANNGKGIAGVSYKATLLPIKIFNNNGGGATTKTMLAGLKYCQDLIENQEVTNLHVINLSVGTYSTGTNETDVLVENQISTLAQDYNVLCVCAGGNGDEVTRKPKTDPLYPSDFDVCLSVTSLDKNGNNSAWSDYNLSKDISAPGEEILSTWCADTSKGSYTYMTGTSMAAPIVSGICAFLWAKNPNLTVSEVKEAVTNTAIPVESNATDGRAGETGSAGAVDAKAALEYVSGGAEKEKSSIEDAKVTFTESSYIYSGERIWPEVCVEMNGEKLVKGTDYKVGYSNNFNAGTAKAEIQGIGKYSGTITKTFEIEKQKISKCTYSLSGKEFVYTGKEIKPEVTLYYNGKVIEQGVDYMVEYSDNIEAGTAKIIVAGIGTNFKGKGYFSFTIVKADSKDEETPEEGKSSSTPSISSGGSSKTDGKTGQTGQTGQKKSGAASGRVVGKIDPLSSKGTSGKTVSAGTQTTSVNAKTTSNDTQTAAIDEKDLHSDEEIEGSEETGSMTTDRLSESDETGSGNESAKETKQSLGGLESTHVRIVVMFAVIMLAAVLGVYFFMRRKR